MVSAIPMRMHNLGGRQPFPQSTGRTGTMHRGCGSAWHFSPFPTPHPPPPLGADPNQLARHTPRPAAAVSFPVRFIHLAAPCTSTPAPAAPRAARPGWPPPRPRWWCAPHTAGRCTPGAGWPGSWGRATCPAAAGGGEAAGEGCCMRSITRQGPPGGPLHAHGCMHLPHAMACYA